MGKNRKVTKMPKPGSLNLDPDRLVSDLLGALALMDVAPKPVGALLPGPSNSDKAARPEDGKTSTEDSKRGPAVSSAPRSGESSIGRSSAILEQFRHDGELLRRMQVTPQELDVLSRSSLLGSATSKQDLLSMLRALRECATSATEPTTGTVYFEMVEGIRRDSLRKLLSGDSHGVMVHRKAWHLVPYVALLGAGAMLLPKMLPPGLVSITLVRWLGVLATKALI